MTCKFTITQLYVDFIRVSVIIKWDSFDLSEIGESVITMWATFFGIAKRGKWYYQVGAGITKLGIFYYTVRQELQKGELLLQSGAGIAKWGNYCKVGQYRGEEMFS